jgi:hypothetical protein
MAACSIETPAKDFRLEKSRGKVGLCSVFSASFLALRFAASTNQGLRAIALTPGYFPYAPPGRLGTELSPPLVNQLPLPPRKSLKEFRMLLKNYREGWFHRAETQEFPTPGVRKSSGAPR